VLERAGPAFRQVRCDCPQLGKRVFVAQLSKPWFCATQFLLKCDPLGDASAPTMANPEAGQATDAVMAKTKLGVDHPDTLTGMANLAFHLERPRPRRRCLSTDNGLRPSSAANCRPRLSRYITVFVYYCRME